MLTDSVKVIMLTLPDTLIEDANRQIIAAKERIAALRKAIKSFKKLKEFPEYAIPESQSCDQSESQQHSV
jgi:hypothetical protein